MLSARLVQTAGIQKSIPKQPKGLYPVGEPVRCHDVLHSAEILSDSVEAAGSAEGALGPAQAARPGHQLRLPPQAVLRAL